MFNQCCVGENDESPHCDHDHPPAFGYHGEAHGSYHQTERRRISREEMEQIIQRQHSSESTSHYSHNRRISDEQLAGGRRILLQSNSMESAGSIGTQEEPETKILQPILQERIVEVVKEEIEEKIIEVPEIRYVNKVVQVPQQIIQEKIVHKKVPVYKERIREVIKPVYEEKIIEVPQVKVVETVIDIPKTQWIEQVVEIPSVIVEERTIMAPKRPTENYVDEVRISKMSSHKTEEMGEDFEYEGKEDNYNMPGVTNVHGDADDPDAIEKVIDIPHVQHSYRNIMTPNYRHIPKPVEVPMTHYRPTPVEKLVDRNVPVPVELQIVQEYLCPKIEPKFREIAVPVHVQRTIEHPVPKEAMGHPQLLPLYYQGTVDYEQGPRHGECAPGGFFNCCAAQPEYITDSRDVNTTVEILSQQAGGGVHMVPTPDGMHQVPAPLYPGNDLAQNVGGFGGQLPNDSGLPSHEAQHAVA